ncbi:MAG: hypothetical protein JSS53_00650 [Proteobacteria bacterium]|nr:hypothetical protein [Pseudomonadota bacterium]
MRKKFEKSICLSKKTDKLPVCERWLFENESALKRLKQGLTDAAEGRVVERGGFEKYLDKD